MQKQKNLVERLVKLNYTPEEIELLNWLIKIHMSLLQVQVTVINSVGQTDRKLSFLPFS